jgi:hypothetical protein
VPWYPDLFSAPLVERRLSHAQDARLAEPVPYWAGVRSGETEALVGSFVSEPELHHPIRGRVRGRRAFERFVAQTNAWFEQHNADTGPIERIITEGRGVEEAMIAFDSERGRVDLPMAIAADRDPGGRIIELRIYYSTWPMTGTHANRPPVLQRVDDVQEPDVVAEYQRALAAGDVDAVLATFESDAYVREPSGGEYVHRGPQELRALYERFFSNGGGVPLEPCTMTDDGRACAMEYNVVRWGRTELLPQAGLAVYVRGSSGKLASARIYDDAQPPIRF